MVGHTWNRLAHTCGQAWARGHAAAQAEQGRKAACAVLAGVKVLMWYCMRLLVALQEFIGSASCLRPCPEAFSSRLSWVYNARCELSKPSQACCLCALEVEDAC